MKKILYIICILYILSVYGCANQEIIIEPSITYEAEVNAVLSSEESECSQLGENIISKCRFEDNLKDCFELKQQWDLKGCSN